MEHLLSTIKYLVEIGFSPLNIVLLCMTYFLGAKQGLFPMFWSSKTEDEKKGVSIKDLYDQMQNLQGYFNHETTERLDDIKFQQVRLVEDVAEIRRKHDEYERFGIRIRKEANN